MFRSAGFRRTKVEFAPLHRAIRCNLRRSEEASVIKMKSHVRTTCCHELLQRSRRKKQRATPHCVCFSRIVMHPLRYPCAAPTVCNSSNARVFYGRSLHLLKQLWHLCPLVRCNVPSCTPLPYGQFINFPSFDPVIFARLDHST